MNWVSLLRSHLEKGGFVYYETQRVVVDPNTDSLEKLVSKMPSICRITGRFVPKRDCVYRIYECNQTHVKIAEVNSDSDIGWWPKEIFVPYSCLTQGYIH